MQKKKGKSKGKGKSSAMLVTLQPDAAGVDIGAEEIYVAVPLIARLSTVSPSHLRHRQRELFFRSCQAFINRYYAVRRE